MGAVLDLRLGWEGGGTNRNKIDTRPDEIRARRKMFGPEESFFEKKEREWNLCIFVFFFFFFFFSRADGEMERLEGIFEVVLEIKIRKGKR